MDLTYRNIGRLMKAAAEENYQIAKQIERLYFDLRLGEITEDYARRFIIVWSFIRFLKTVSLDVSKPTFINEVFARWLSEPSGKYFITSPLSDHVYQLRRFGDIDIVDASDRTMEVKWWSTRGVIAVRIYYCD